MSVKAEIPSVHKREDGGAPSIVSAGVRIHGNIDSTGDVQLDGSVEGTVRCASLTVGEGGRVMGLIEAESVIVRGTVTGDIRANSLRLEKTARLEGDMVHRSISIEAGARIGGHIVHAEEPLKSEPAGIGPAADGAGMNGKPRPARTDKAEAANPSAAA